MPSYQFIPHIAGESRNHSSFCAASGVVGYYAATVQYEQC